MPFAMTNLTFSQIYQGSRSFHAERSKNINYQIHTEECVEIFLIYFTKNFQNSFTFSKDVIKYNYPYFCKGDTL